MEVAAVEQREFGCTQGRIRARTLIYFVIETIHQLFGRCVRYVPQAGNYVVGSGSQERPGEPYQAFSGICAGACAITCRNRNQIRAHRVLNNIASIELERVGFDGAL